MELATLTDAGDGSDWNLTELGVLGDISIAVPHAEPFAGVVVFTPGALLRNGRGLPVQVLAEFCVNATAKFKLPEDKVVRILESPENYPVIPIDEAVFWAALTLKNDIRFHAGIAPSSQPLSNPVASGGSNSNPLSNNLNFTRHQ